MGAINHHPAKYIITYRMLNIVNGTQLLFSYLYCYILLLSIRII